MVSSLTNCWRSLLLTLLLCLVPISLAGSDQTAAPPAKNFVLHELGDGVWAAIATSGGEAGSNAGFVIGDDGVAVVDTFQSPAAAKELLKTIRSLTTLPIRFVVNTHYHLDHVAGNGVFRDVGAVILAQRNVRAWERTENLKWWGASVPESARRMVESLVLPQVLYDEGVELYLGSRKLEVLALPGHTGSDSIVVVPDASVVFTGDLFWNRTLPNMTDADTAAWLRTDARLLRSYPDATLMPGHGEIGTAADLAEFRQYLKTLREDVKNAVAAGKRGEGLLAAVKTELEPQYGAWSFYGHFIDDNVTQQADELAGRKRRPGMP